MGLIRANITLSNPREPSLAPVTVNALVDTGSIALCVPEHIALQLNLQEIEKREVTVADDRRILAPYVGPLQVRFGNRSCFTGALVLGESVLMGALPMEDMDLIVHPTQQTVVVNPESPN